MLRDIDEDELLQIALREQAQRDLSYQKPSKNSKPIVNLLQPPPAQRDTEPRSKSSSSKPPQKPQWGRVEDDDDSEVELLRISSREKILLEIVGSWRSAEERGRVEDDDDSEDSSGDRGVSQRNMVAGETGGDEGRMPGVEIEAGMMMNH